MYNTYEEGKVELLFKHKRYEELNQLSNNDHYRHLISLAACKYGIIRFIRKIFDSLLGIACNYGQTEVVEYLLNKGQKFFPNHIKDIMSSDSVKIFKLYRTRIDPDLDHLVYLAVETKADKILKYLLDNGAKRIDFINAKTKTAYDLLVEKKTTPDAFWKAIEIGDQETFNDLCPKMEQSVLRYGLVLAIKHDRDYSFILERINGRCEEALYEANKKDNISLILQLYN